MRDDVAKDEVSVDLILLTSLPFSALENGS
jgi:hypothetical protein